jgi:nucleoside 2-deoxyribosyltransferase
MLDRDRYDLARCDLVLANLLGARTVSIGSVGEIFWADAMRKPVVLVREPHFNVHDHALINAIACCVVDNLDAAVAKINLLLLPMSKADQVSR